jgi:O-methyltransferase
MDIGSRQKGIRRREHHFHFFLVASMQAAPDRNLDFEKDAYFLSIASITGPYTMTTPERVYSLIQATHYITNNRVEGAIVECGVWRGGSLMTSALALINSRDCAREIWGFDTFSGMTRPTEVDVNVNGTAALSRWPTHDKGNNTSDWCFATLEDVASNIAATKYPPEKIALVKGDVTESLKGKLPEKIALLRLDVDWYEPTRVCLDILFPRLAKGGVLIIDDYGHWQGASKATDEYFECQGIKPFLHRVDYSCRLMVKSDYQTSL